MNSIKRQLGFIGAALNFVGGILQNKANAKQAAEANQVTVAMQEDSQEFNREEAQANRDFQERMANSAHQREVADLRQAGLNPILSGTGGMGSMTPSGATASSSGGQGTKAEMQNVVSSALQGQRLDAEIDLMREQASRERSQVFVNQQTAQREEATAQNQRSQAELNQVEAANRGGPTRANIEQQTRTSSAQELYHKAGAYNQESQIWLNKARTITEKFSADVQAQHAKILIEDLKAARRRGEVDATQYGQIMEYISRAIPFVNSGSAASRAFGR
ncbi:MAG: DNA pilot protein [Arizlama microvirus]|nr:MAG: DNA pilot protein [Arizlama microvirus]